MEPLVQINKPGQERIIDKIFSGSIADKFFIAGALSSILGIGWLGSHLWLRLNSSLPIGSDFGDLRHLHILIQFYLFFGLFVLGFIAQAAPKLLGVSEKSSPLTLLWIPSLLLGVIVSYNYQDSLLGKIIISSIFLCATAYLISFVSKASQKIPIFVGIWLLIGLIFFIASPLMNLQTANGALLAFWLTITPIIFGASQQFIAAFLGGDKIPPKHSIQLLLLYFAASCCAVITSISPATLWAYHSWGLLALLAFVLHALRTSYYKAIREIFKKPLAFALVAGFFWAFIGALNLTFYGLNYLDFTLHIWAVGWATTLIIGVSIQIVSFMGDKRDAFTRPATVLLLMWQVVAAGRGFSHIIKLPSYLPWVVLTAATIVVIGWTVVLLLAEKTILQRARALRTI